MPDWDATLELCLKPATEQFALLRGREVSAVELLEHHLAVVERVDPAVNAIVTRTEELARSRAVAADRALADGTAGALCGLPVAHKDFTATKGIRTTLGSPLFADHVPDVDALCVERIRGAGAVTVGKTNTPELAAGSQTYNALFGATRNPYALDRTSGGSSGGAAAALACGMVAIADGTDMGGSLRNPASFCNVVGLRPSPGVVPVLPTPSLWEPLVIHGPMGRTVGDVALLLSVMAGPDPRAPLGSGLPAGLGGSLERDLRGVRIAWSRDLDGLPVEPGVTEVLERQRALLERLGCVVEEVEPDLSGADEAFEAWRAFLFELGFGALYDDEERRQLLNEDVQWNIRQGKALSAGELAAAERARGALYARTVALLQRYDFLVGPVVQVLPFDVEKPYPTSIAGQPMGSYIEWMRSCSRISATALPAVSVPFGFTDDGLPVGLQIVGRQLGDWEVLQFAHAIEREAGCIERRPPVLEATPA